MITENINTRELFASFDEAAVELLEVISLLDKRELNNVPFKDSWTAGQVAEHVSKSIAFITNALNATGEITAREPDKRVNELKETFLNFTVKFKSPEFILPTQDKYDKQALIANLTRLIKEFKEARADANLTEAIIDPALGELTKLELLYLALYHTQRHIRQLKIISGAVVNQQ